jgi:uncharacterized protein
MSTVAIINHAATVAKLYEAFGRGDISYIIDHLADDCRWVGSGEGSLLQGGTYIGKEAVNFFKKLGQEEDITSFNPQSINNINEDEVVVFGNMAATLRKTGKKASSDWVMHWKFNEDGKVVYFHDFFDTAAAYRANQ